VAQSSWPQILRLTIQVLLENRWGHTLSKSPKGKFRKIFLENSAYSTSKILVVIPLVPHVSSHRGKAMNRSEFSLNPVSYSLFEKATGIQCHPQPVHPILMVSCTKPIWLANHGTILNIWGRKMKTSLANLHAYVITSSIELESAHWPTKDVCICKSA